MSQGSEGDDSPVVVDGGGRSSSPRLFDEGGMELAEGRGTMIITGEELLGGGDGREVRQSMSLSSSGGRERMADPPGGDSVR
jgi:hypothetical protein